VLCGVLEHLKIETRLINERFDSVMGECDLEVENTRFMYHLDNSIVPTSEKKIKIGTSVKKSVQPKTSLCEEGPAKEPTEHKTFFSNSQDTVRFVCTMSTMSSLIFKCCANDSGHSNLPNQRQCFMKED
jgi:hypothetical protein